MRTGVVRLLRVAPSEGLHPQRILKLEDFNFRTPTLRSFRGSSSAEDTETCVHVFAAGGGAFLQRVFIRRGY